MTVEAGVEEDGEPEGVAAAVHVRVISSGEASTIVLAAARASGLAKKGRMVR